MENLLKVEDIAIEKAKKYGVEMIEKIKSFCNDKAAEMDVMPSQVIVATKVIYHVLKDYGLRYWVSLRY